MRKILIVDDSKITLSLIEKSIKKEIKDVEVLLSENYKDALKLILKHGKSIDIAVIDLHLPGSKDGAMIDVVESNSIKSIVLSGTLDAWSKEIIFGKRNIIQCVAKDGKKGIKTVVSSINRELKNINKNVLVVEHSKEQQIALKKILHMMKLNMLLASNGQEALDIISNTDKKISLVLTCYHMPVMDGIDFTFKLRETYDKDELGIIVVSSHSTPQVASQFLKIGANDCINKPYQEQDMISRISANLELIDLFEQTKDMANKDFMTGAYNRRYFFDFVHLRAKKIKRNTHNIVIAMLDIDHFKKVNDSYGHDVGDKVICYTADVLKSHMRSSDLVSRFGGEEFCIMIDDISYENTEAVFEKIRSAFKNNILDVGTNKVKFTVSIGIYFGEVLELDEMIKKADQALYHCKESGRDQIYLTSLV